MDCEANDRLKREGVPPAEDVAGPQQPSVDDDRADFYNTISLTGDELAEAKSGARTQESRVLAYFRAFPDLELTPWQVQSKFPRWPITSVRRAITNLTAEGCLVRTHHQRPGPHGKPSYCWKLRRRSTSLRA